MNLQAEKAIIIEQFKQVDDVNLIHAIKNMLDYALKKEKESLDIPEAHQKLVLDRLNKVRKNPERLLDWDEAKKTLTAWWINTKLKLNPKPLPIKFWLWTVLTVILKFGRRKQINIKIAPENQNFF